MPLATPFGVFRHVFTHFAKRDCGMDYFGSEQPDGGHAHENGGETKGRDGKRILDDVHSFLH